jgi:tetratricopeptide (TPR) repeat protein
MSPDEEARAISTVQDVEAVIRSPRASFEEWLDCASVARAAGRWELVEVCACSALRAVGRRAVAPYRLLDAARLVAIAHFRRVSSLRLLKERNSLVHEQLQRLIAGLPADIKKSTDPVLDELSEISLLVADGSPASWIRLCSRLRRLERPDLGREAADQALQLDHQSAPALTTRAAAALDLEDVEGAMSDLQQAWVANRSPYVANTYSRAHLMAGELGEATRWARISVSLDEPASAGGWRVLASVAKLTDDADLFDEAVGHLAGDDPDQLQLFGTDPGRRWVEVLAARELLRAGQLDATEALVRSVLAEGEYPPARRLEAELRAKRQDRENRSPGSGAGPGRR